MLKDISELYSLIKNQREDIRRKGITPFKRQEGWRRIYLWRFFGFLSAIFSSSIFVLICLLIRDIIKHISIGKLIINSIFIAILLLIVYALGETFIDLLKNKKTTFEFATMVMPLIIVYLIIFSIILLPAASVVILFVIKS